MARLRTHWKSWKRSLRGATVLRVGVVTCLIVALFVPVWSAASPAGGADGSGRIVAVGDVHGNLDQLTTALRLAGLIDDSHVWIGGDATFVLTGDFTDRGPRVREVMDLLMRLETEAPRHGGRVVVLFGNHEMMNLIGDLRYVTERIFADFAGTNAAKRRDHAYKHYARWLQAQARLFGEPLPADWREIEREWMEAHPLGYVEYVEAMGVKGRYGKWLRRLPVAAQIGDCIFLHAGIHPNLRDLNVDEINRRVDRERKAFDSWRDILLGQRMISPWASLGEMIAAATRHRERLSEAARRGRTVSTFHGLPADHLAQVLSAFLGMGDWLSMHPDGPLWFRGFATWSEEEGTPQVAATLEGLGARHLVVSHTVLSEGEIGVRFDGRVFLIDTDLPSALVIEEGRFRAVYLHGVRELPVGEPALRPMTEVVRP
jgi:hypothetical protein